MMTLMSLSDGNIRYYIWVMGTFHNNDDFNVLIQFQQFSYYECDWFALLALIIVVEKNITQGK